MIASHQQIAAKLQLISKSFKTCREVDYEMAARRLHSAVCLSGVQEPSARCLLLLRTIHAECPQGTLLHYGSSVSVTLLMLKDCLPVWTRAHDRIKLAPQNQIHLYSIRGFPKSYNCYYFSTAAEFSFSIWMQRSLVILRLFDKLKNSRTKIKQKAEVHPLSRDMN